MPLLTSTGYSTLAIWRLQLVKNEIALTQGMSSVCCLNVDATTIIVPTETNSDVADLGRGNPSIGEAVRLSAGRTTDIETSCSSIGVRFIGIHCIGAVLRFGHYIPASLRTNRLMA